MFLPSSHVRFGSEAEVAGSGLGCGQHQRHGSASTGTDDQVSQHPRLGYREHTRGIGDKQPGKTQPVERCMIWDEPLHLSPPRGGETNIQPGSGPQQGQ